MRVGILGSGDVGRALGKGFVSREHEVKIGSRTPNSDKLKTWVNQMGRKASTGTFADSAAFGDIIVLATNGSAIELAIDLAKPQNLNGKLVIDVTNQLDFSRGPPPGMLYSPTDSLGQRVQRKLPSAKIVKCFNTVPNSQMVDPKFKDVEMMICGNDLEAKQQVMKILREFGWKGAIDIGGIENAGWLEAFVPLWARVGMSLNTWDHVFKVVR
jgi:predicted dinucleotide-binding enzyme